MIDAVQELIQTHEAFEEEGGSAEKDAKEKKANVGTAEVSETKEGDNEEEAVPDRTVLRKSCPRNMYQAVQATQQVLGELLCCMTDNSHVLPIAHTLIFKVIRKLKSYKKYLGNLEVNITSMFAMISILIPCHLE